MTTQEEFDALKLMYKSELESLCLRMQEDLGTLEAAEMMSLYSMNVQKNLNNTVTVESMVDEWLDNIHSNMRAQNLPWWPVKKGKLKYPFRRNDGQHPALIIGAGPSCTVPKLRELAGFTHLTICTNKSLERTIQGLNVFPDVCVIVDSDPNILAQLTPDCIRDAMESGITKFLIATQCHPNVVKWICSFTPEENVFFFHASIPDAFMPNVNHMLKTFWDVPVMDTGGNAGIFSIHVAKEMGANIIGLMGLEHSHKLDPKWKDEEALLYKIVYSPDNHQIFAVTPSFQGYINTIVSWVKQHREEVRVVNLSNFGWFYIMRDKIPMEYMSRKEFGDTW